MQSSVGCDSIVTLNLTVLQNTDCIEAVDLGLSVMWATCNVGAEKPEDGKFEEEKKDLNLKFRGSRNQRIIDVQKSLNAHKVIPYDV